MSSAVGWAHGRLWSLLEMLGKYASAYVYAVEIIDGLMHNLDEIMKHPQPGGDKNTDALMLAVMGKEVPLAKAYGDSIEGAVRALIESLLTRMSFPSVIAQSNRLSNALKNNAGPKEVKGILKELKTRLLDELNERLFLYVKPESVHFYNQPMLMGKDVNERFPQAIDDIEEAGKCLALGQGTACVLHTMRVLEVGLKALAKALGIPYAPSWESYLTQIATNIGKKHKDKTAKWKRDEKFYRDLSGDLLIVKQVWRNPTMHVDRKYSAEEA
ncbi:MAG: hypothetical protein J0I29_00710, partial [Rhizobiales bacterium]|nr:hypothetical protein [Hyphomicrobiales bacterium]